MKADRPQIWYDVSSQAGVDSSLLSAVFNSPIHCLLANPSQLSALNPPTHIKIACRVQEAQGLEEVAEKADIFVSSSKDYLALAKKKGLLSAYYGTIKDGLSLDDCRAMIGHVDYLVAKLLDETNIPLELIIAEAQNTHTAVIKETENWQQALVNLGVLERGCDGVLLSSASIQEIVELKRKLMEIEESPLLLAEAEVVALKHVGMGHRGCIDTISMMEMDEGMVVGSTSQGGILVCSEVHPLPYMNTRPFRVNAGAVHSYVWAPNGSTEYMTDLKVGSKILAVNTHGKARPVVTGRVKIEVRPLLLMEARVGEATVNVILQDDWHVRVFGADGKPKNCTTLKPGDKLLAHVCEPGRHVGIKVNETIIER
ncbi:MAG: 3-dehydroquinate synthase [Deltaproteobacteria bacterium]|nr:3-dehydroquinate synthase [Deltaproteobacteria bacterium]